MELSPFDKVLLLTIPCYNRYMTSGESKWRRKFSRWCDDWRLAGSGIILATKNRKYLLVFALSFIIFGTLMSLLSSSTAALKLFWTADWGWKLKIIGDGFLGLFGVGRSFWEWFLIFIVTLLQSTLIGLVALVWRKKRRSKTDQIVATASNADHLQNAGLAAGLAVLGSGCPTCGTTLLMPVLGTLFSSSSYALASTISGILTAAAMIVALFSLKRIGKEAYGMIVSERYQKKHAEAQKGTTES